ncbi:ABC transporter permease [Salegentibacter sp. JZCK2]|uniref:ABC transporter permease n=1 Tax=Salegentibacter tibetensis TaxID=2873600 RepID=UPI001CC95411|nr:ABC transporter permease [Salegentibacter tibetensis]MBZ9731144.1 ABC transporter permease [Salegentibacter tibetensis]
MIKNIIKVAFRYLVKHKGYTFINITGLAVGIAACILIALFVRSEWSFNKMHSQGDRIHRAWLQEHYQGEIFNNTATPIPLAPLLAANLPEVEAATRINEISAPIIHQGNTFNYAVTMVDSTLFRIFDFELLKGDIKNPFPTKNSIIISEETAKVFFGNTEPVGETLELVVGGENMLFTISGILEDIPYESSIRMEFIIPFSNAVHIWPEQTRTSGWTSVYGQTYVLLKQGADPAAVNSKIPAFMDPLVSQGYKPGEYIVTLQPLSDIHFNTALPEELTGASNPLYAYILATVGILILLIACVNFITLATGRSATRAMEVGVRKVMGAQKKQLIAQFFGESFLVTLMALITGILLAFLLLKSFNQMANREFVLGADPFMVIFCLFLLFFITLFAGGYPALVLSSFQPVKVLKGNIKTSGMGIFGKSLIIGQFVASIVMIICTIIIGKQLNYLQSKDLGFGKEHVIIVPTNRSIAEGNTLAAKYITELESNPKVVSASNSLFTMAEFGWAQIGYQDDNGAYRMLRFNAVDPNFIKTMGLQLVQGRGFMKDNPADSSGIVVNQALVQQYGWEDPLGKKLPGKYPQEIIGVVEDFHFESLHSPIQPAVMALGARPFFQLSSDVSMSYSASPRVSVKFREGNLEKHVAVLENTWKSVAGDQDFQFRFLDESLAAAYEQERRLGKIVQYASVLSIFIACLGLFGLATLVVARRRKEIGIRKVLGADVSTLVATLNKDFVIQILIASIIAFPLAWFMLNRWMRDFEYRIDIPFWVFAVAALIVMLVAMVTVSFQSIKAALSNPVKGLRSE